MSYEDLGALLPSSYFDSKYRIINDASDKHVALNSIICKEGCKR